MLAEKIKCCGCSACATICPVNAINMKYDEDMFLYPEIDTHKCIKCAKCENVCPVINLDIIMEEKIYTYCGHYKDEKKLVKSSSGGFMSALSEYVISCNGCVYGVIYNDDFSHAIYKKADTMKELDAFKGSKYIMSELNPDIYYDIERELKANRLVLFTGCPCEVYAVRKYLGKEYVNLITCELICQGGTTPIALKEQIDIYENMLQQKVKYVNMRAKPDGLWFPYKILVEGNKGAEIFEELSQTNFDVAFKNFKRESCYNCSFRFPYSAADITAGDYIGINQNDIGYNKAGVSILFVHTLKGKKILRELKEFELYEADFDKSAGIQTCLYNCISKADITDKFKKLLHDSGLACASEFAVNYKCGVFEKFITDLQLDRKSEFKYIVWGGGKYFQEIYNAVNKELTNAKLLAVVDKYKRGIIAGVEFITAEDLKNMDFDHIFITTVAGQKEAVQTLQLIFGKNFNNYSIAIPDFEISIE